MANVNQTTAIGATIFGAAPRARDDSGDSKNPGGNTYLHNVLQFSATEAGEWVSWRMYAETQLNMLRFFKCV